MLHKLYFTFFVLLRYLWNFHVFCGYLMLTPQAASPSGLQIDQYFLCTRVGANFSNITELNSAFISAQSE